MKPTVLGVIGFAVALAFQPVSAQGQALQPEICRAGPYAFDVSAGILLPSVGRQVAALGLSAGRAGCSSYVVTCVIRPSAGEADKIVAEREAQLLCRAIRDKLLINFRSSTANSLGVASNTEARNAVKMRRVQAGAANPVGIAIVAIVD